MRGFEDAGLGDLIARPDPLLPDGAVAIHCWHWCGGWAPERWPLYAELHDVADWDLHMDLMTIIKGVA